MHLSAFMEKNGLSDLEVAKGINRDRATVSRIRRRKVRPNWQTTEKLKGYSRGKVTANDFQQLGAVE